MHTLKKIVYYLIVLLSVITISATLLSLLYDVNVWWIKALDFPRIQLLLLGGICLLIIVTMTHRWTLGSMLLAAGLLTSVGLQAYFIYPYTPLSGTDVRSLDASLASSDASVSLLIANVYMHNRQVGSLVEVVEEINPDMVLLMETDQWWMNALQPLRLRYPHVQEYAADNTYGMGLYSRYPWQDMQVKFLQHDSVPSFHAEVQLPNGQSFWFHGVHPVPPVYSKYPDNEGEEEVALIKVGRMVAQHQQPTVVAGDFNDVAWSNTSRLFQVEGQLSDTRVGRGLYNSFDAQSSVMRWPLDHVYVSGDFALTKLQRLNKFGSDHFPIHAVMVLKEE
ncbi:MAG: endonuclease/exonuclease/phosphatase family protein [Tunicatimonas sp.]|uniref:endonuclease/exonuclease/phosphatase family protein n=1 Tax=Tunicatimonas sp. TaxID=1940096 RepID=UPI003C78B127